MTQKKIMIVLLVAGFCLCGSANAELLYTVTNLNSSGSGSFASALASAETDGQASRIEFSVGGTIYQSARYNITAGSCTISGGSAPAPGITFDFNGASEGFHVTSANNYFCNIRVINTLANTDGISLLTGSVNNTVERCSFDYCRDEAVGISGADVRGTIVAYCRIENCGSQADPYPDGRGILITMGASATIVGNYVYHCNRGITVNTANGFGDFRHTLVKNSLSPASGNGITLVGGGVSGNVIDSNSSLNALNGFRYKDDLSTGAPTFYRSGNTGYGNALSLESIDPTATEVFNPIVVADTPFPAWLSGATTPKVASDVGMGTGTCNCDGNAPPPDTTPPTPNPMTWATVPYATSSTSISMTATTASDVSGVDYYFTCTAGGGHDSGWQAGTTYQDTGLQPSTTYTYTVKARDRSPALNETAASTAQSATTPGAPPGKATNPNPANGATKVSRTPTLSWTAGAGATSHDVYFGTANPPPFIQNQTGTSYVPGALAGNKTHYWRIDEKNSNGTTTGDLWSFKTGR